MEQHPCDEKEFKGFKDLIRIESVNPELAGMGNGGH